MIEALGILESIPNKTPNPSGLGVFCFSTRQEPAIGRCDGSPGRPKLFEEIPRGNRFHTGVDRGGLLAIRPER